MIDDIKRKLQQLFPGELFSAKTIEEDLANGDILTSKEAILPYLQTALFDEKVLEVQLDGRPMVYFSRLKDGIPTPLDEEEGEEATEEGGEGSEVDAGEGTTTAEGAFIAAMNHIVTLPLEPGLGNLHLRLSTAIVLRMFTNTLAIEFATSFVDLAKVHDIPVLLLAFPNLARIVREAREYRAKVPDSLDLMLALEVDEDSPEVETRPVSVSIRGISFAATKYEQRRFKINTAYSMKLFLEDELLVRIEGNIRHLSKIRKRSGIEYICGVEFNFQTKIQATVIESIVATVQRAHLKELSEKSHVTGIRLIA